MTPANDGWGDNVPKAIAIQTATFVFVAVAVMFTTVFQFAVLSAVTSEAGARLTCMEHPTWHYHDKGLVMRAACLPPSHDHEEPNQ